VLRRAVELGVNFIDTADAYGPAVAEQHGARTRVGDDQCVGPGLSSSGPATAGIGMPEAEVRSGPVPTASYSRSLGWK
jgi:hypothetical protein